MRLLFCRFGAQSFFIAYCLCVTSTFSVNNSTTNENNENIIEPELLRFFLSSSLNDPHANDRNETDEIFNVTSFMADGTHSHDHEKENVIANDTKAMEPDFVVENSTLDLIMNVLNKSKVVDFENNSTSIVIHENVSSSLNAISSKQIFSKTILSGSFAFSSNNSMHNDIIRESGHNNSFQQIQCQTPLLLNSTHGDNKNLVFLTVNFTQQRDDGFLSTLCEKILGILCDDLMTEKSSCDLNLQFFELPTIDHPSQTTAFSIINGTGANVSGSRVLLILKKHQKRLENELGLTFFKQPESTSANHYHDMSILTALTAAIAGVCIAALLSLIVLIVWQSWRRQSSGEWVLNKPTRDHFDVVYFENKGYIYDDKHLSKPISNGNDNYETKTNVSSESICRSVQTFSGSSDDVCLVPKDMMEMLEKSFPTQNFDERTN